MNKPILGLVIAATFVLGISGIESQQAFADIIDFEIGFVNEQIVTVVITATNTVTFGVSPCAAPGDAFIAETGAPVTAYAPGDAIPAGASGGSFFLTNKNAGPNKLLDYCISFATPVNNLSVDLYDYRADGGGSVGGIATLSVFNASSILVGSDTFVITAGLPDPNLATLSIPSRQSSLDLISSAELSFDSPDKGTGIDNITFTTLTVIPPLIFAEVYKVSGVSVIPAGTSTNLGNVVELRCLDGDLFLNTDPLFFLTLNPSLDTTNLNIGIFDSTPITENNEGIIADFQKIIGYSVRAEQEGAFQLFNIPVTIAGFCLSP